MRVFLVQTAMSVRSAALHARYGENGPTGHASMDGAKGPVSLSAFIGGKANGPRLGHLAGDGRGPPPEAAFAADVDVRALVGMADPDVRSMASFLKEREQRLQGTEKKAADAKDVAAAARREAAEAKAEATAARIKAECAEKLSISASTDTPEGEMADTGKTEGGQTESEQPGAEQRNDQPGQQSDQPDQRNDQNQPNEQPTEPDSKHEPSAGPRRSTSGKRITVLISGSGSNFQAIIDATTGTDPLIPNAQITQVISNRMNAYGLERAKKANPPIPTAVMSLKTYQNRNPGASREDYDLALAKKVLADGEPDIIVLAGFMHIVSETFLNALGHKTSLSPLPDAPREAVPIINLHPALPGAFDGASAIERAFEAFQRGDITNTGIMVHEVVAEVDRGQPIIVEEVQIVPEEPLDALEDRMHAVEHRLIVEATRRVLENAHTFGRTCDYVYRELPGNKRKKQELQAAEKAVHSAQPPEVKAFFVTPPSSLSSTAITTPFVVTDTDVVLVTGAATYIWHGARSSAISSASLEPATHITQGEEPAGFIEALGGMFVTRRADGTGIFVVRHTARGVFINESGPEAISSAWSVVTRAGGTHVWHGSGSDAVQREAAQAWAKQYSTFTEHEEGYGWAPSKSYASGRHHRYCATLPKDERDTLLYSHSRPTGVPFTSKSVSPNEVALVVSPFEIYVLVGANVRGDRAQISTMLDRAEHEANVLHTRRGPSSLLPTVVVVVFPTIVPSDMIAAAYYWDDSHLQITADTRNSPVLMNVHTLADARDQLAAGDLIICRHAVRANYLPVGCAPSA